MGLQSKGSLILLLHLSNEHIQSIHSTRYYKEEHKIMKLILANTPQNLSFFFSQFQKRFL